MCVCVCVGGGGGGGGGGVIEEKGREEREKGKSPKSFVNFTTASCNSVLSPITVPPAKDALFPIQLL